MKISRPIFDWVQETKEPSYLQILILSTAIQHGPSYKLVNELAEKAIDALQGRLAHEKNAKTILPVFYFNMTYRLLRARYFDMKNAVKQKAELQEIKRLFYHYVNLVQPIHETKKLFTLKTVIEIRVALFEGNCDEISAGLERLRVAKEYDWLKVTKDEVVEYCSKLNNILTTPLRNLMAGVRIKRCREMKKMTAFDFAMNLGTNQQVVNEFESGKRGISRTRLHNIAEILGVDIAYFSGEEDEPSLNVENDMLKHRVYRLLRSATKDQQEYLMDFMKTYLKKHNKPRKAGKNVIKKSNPEE